MRGVGFEVEEKGRGRNCDGSASEQERQKSADEQARKKPQQTNALTNFGSILARIDPFSMKLPELHLRWTYDGLGFSKAGWPIEGRFVLGTLI